MRGVLIALGVVAVLLCIVCGAGLLITGGGLLQLGRSALQTFQSLAKTGDQFLTHMQTGNFAAARQMVAPTAQATLTENELRKRWNALRSKVGEVQSWEFEDHSLDTDLAGTRGILTVKVQGSKRAETLKLTLKLEGEQWLITGMQVGQ